jgi:COMPASS component SWD3
MSDCDFFPQQPQSFDAVLGDQTLAANSSAVLGGIDGIKTRLHSENIHIVILALKDAMNYGDAGLHLVIK